MLQKALSLWHTISPMSFRDYTRMCTENDMYTLNHSKPDVQLRLWITRTSIEQMCSKPISRYHRPSDDSGCKRNMYLAHAEGQSRTLSGDWMIAPLSVRTLQNLAPSSKLAFATPPALLSLLLHSRQVVTSFCLCGSISFGEAGNKPALSRQNTSRVTSV